MRESSIVNQWTKFWDSVKGGFSIEGLIKLITDIILMNLAILVALATRLLYLIAISSEQTNINYQATLLKYISAYGNSAWLLTLIGVIIFSINGFYTHGRFYRGRYKILIIVQAVTITYVLFGFLSYLAQGPLLGFMKGYLNLPRGTLVFAWIITSAMLAASRTWAALWDRVVHSNRKRGNDFGNREIKRVLVIGGAGYIGSALLPLLLGKGLQVRILDLLVYGSEPIQPWMDHPHLELIQDDFRQIDVVVRAMQDVDAVVHLGAIVGDAACDLVEKVTLDINLMATKTIAEIAKGCQVGHFVFASTCSVYGASEQLLDEHSEMKPVTLYARTKGAAEQALLQMADERFSPVILRFSTVYGLSGRYRFDLVVNLLTAKAMFDGEITIFGGNQWRSFVHVEDAARAIMAVLESPILNVRREIFNVGSNEQNYTIAQVGEIIHNQVPAARIVKIDDLIDPQNYRVNFHKIQRVLNYVPRWTIEQGVQQVIGAIRGGQVTDYKDARYSNLKFLSSTGMNLLERGEEVKAFDFFQ